MRPIKISNHLMRQLSFFYIGLPFFIFGAIWLQWYVSLPVLVVYLYSFLITNKVYIADFEPFKGRQFRAISILLALLVIFIYIYFSGIGSFSFQNEDHHYRNAIFQDLVKNKWPVLYQIKGFGTDNPLDGKQAMLVYYLGYWLPAATIGKVFGIEWGRFFLFLWSVLGVGLIFYFLCQFFKKFSLKVLWLFLGWGSLYFIGTFFHFPIKDVLKGEAYLWAGNLLFADGTTGLIYWTFNQTIVPWLIILLVVNQFSSKTIFFFTSLMFFSAPFSFIGFLPFVLYFIYKNDIAIIGKIQNWPTIFSKYFTFPNTLGALTVLLVSYLYFSTNSSGNVFNFVMPNLTIYFVFFVLSVGIILMLIFDRNKSNGLYYLIASIFVFLPFFQLGFGLDFTARVSIPAMFFLMLLVGDYLFYAKRSIRKSAVFFYMVLAAIGHNIQVGRSIYFTGLQAFSNTNLGVNWAKNNNKIIKNLGDRMVANKAKNITIKNNLDSLNNPNNMLVRNFMGGTKGSFFYHYLARK